MKQLLWIIIFWGFLFIFFKFTKKTDVNEKLFLYVSIIVLIFSAPFVYYTITIESPIGFIYPEQYDAWIGFFGSIIGGVLTVLGVWWTIDVQEKTRRKDLATEYKPFLDFIRYEKHLPKGVNYASIEYKFNKTFAEEVMSEFDKHKNQSTKIFSMGNIGRGVLSNICLEKVIIEDNYLSELISFDKTTIGSVAPDQVIYLKIVMPPMMQIEEEKKIESKIKFIFTGTDEFKYNEFSIELIFVLLMERYKTHDYLLDGFVLNDRYEIIDMDTHFYNKRSNEQIY